MIDAFMLIVLFSGNAQPYEIYYTDLGLCEQAATTIEADLKVLATCIYLGKEMADE